MGDETKQHVLRIVGKGAIIGLEDVILSNRDTYETTAICHSQTVELFTIDKEIF